MDDITKDWAYGHIAMLDLPKGFGFLKPESDSPDVHFRVCVVELITWSPTGGVHISAGERHLIRCSCPWPSDVNLTVGDRVAYRIYKYRDRPTAEVVTPADLLDQARQQRAAYAAECERRRSTPEAQAEQAAIAEAMRKPHTPEQAQAWRDWAASFADADTLKDIFNPDWD